MRFQISNICLHGFFKREAESEEEVTKRKIIEHFRQSVIQIYPKSLWVTITKEDVRELFLSDKKKLHQTVKDTIEKVIGKNIYDLSLKVVNIHLHKQLNIGHKEGFFQITPKLQEIFQGVKTEYCIEPGATEPVNVKTISRSEKKLETLFYFSIYIPDPFVNKTYMIKSMKVANNPNKSNITVILGALSPIAQNIINFFETYDS